jgi:hypothetical protein
LAHIPSVARIDASEFTGSEVPWPTPRTNDSTGDKIPPNRAGGLALKQAVQEAGSWPTPMVGGTSPASHGQVSGQWRRQMEASLPMASPWATPSTRDHKDTIGMATTGTNPDGSTRTRLDQLPRQAAQIAPWPTPDAAAMNNGQDWDSNQARRDRLKAKHNNGNGAGLTLGGAASGVIGPTPTGSPAATEKPAKFQLNPLFSLWLMLGPFATAWASCGEQVMRSSRKLPRSSFERLLEAGVCSDPTCEAPTCAKYYKKKKPSSSA